MSFKTDQQNEALHQLLDKYGAEAVEGQNFFDRLEAFLVKGAATVNKIEDAADAALDKFGVDISGDGLGDSTQPPAGDSGSES